MLGFSTYMKVVRKSCVAGVRCPVTRILQMAVGVLCLALQTSAWAMTATPKLGEASQPDGTKIKLYVRGDEYNHWYEDERGFTAVYGSDKRTFVYAILDAAGQLAPTKALVGSVDPVALGFKKGVKPSPEVMLANRLKTIPPNLLTKNGESVFLPMTASSGTVKNLVILCKFSDHAFGTHTRSQGEFDSLFNLSGTNAVAPTGSLKTFFETASYGTLHFQSTLNSREV